MCLFTPVGGEKVLLSYIQDHPAGHVPLEDVLKALNINTAKPEGEGATGGEEASSLK